MFRHSVYINKIAGVLSKETKTIEEVESLTRYLSQNEDFNKITAKISKVEKNHLVKSLSCQVFSAGEVIFSKGDPVLNFFIVLRGTVEHISSEKNQRVVSTLVAGKPIGDKTYMRQTTRNTACVAVTDCLLLDISIETFREILGDDANLNLHKKMKFIDQFFPGIKKYSFSHREKIAHLLVFTPLKKNNVINIQGEVSEFIYFLCEGEVVLTNDNLKIPILKITPGSCIGEEALLNFPNEYNAVVSSDQAAVYAVKKEENLQFIPEETKEAWKQNFLLKKEERKRLSSNAEIRRNLISTSPKRFEFALASPQAKKHLNIVSLRYNLASSHKDFRETKSFQNSKRILELLRDNPKEKKTNVKITH
jgi:CRP-like cAMP-binding protein